MLIKIDEQLA